MADITPDAPSDPKRVIFVTDDEGEQRLDRWLGRRWPDMGHAALQKWLRTGQIRVDGKRAKGADRVVPGQGVRVPPALFYATAPKPSPVEAPAWLKDLILFEDDDVIALNKPAGLAVQGGTGLKHNLDAMLAGLVGGKGPKPKLVHRLDRETSGVLLVAKNDVAAARMAEAFRARTTRKIYWAITLGAPQPAEGLIDAPLVKRGETMEPDSLPRDPSAKPAETLYRIEATAKGVAFVVLRPLTGRTHQLRVHLAACCGTPILGDRLYGGLPLPSSLAKAPLGAGLHLHARRIIMPHPRGKQPIDVTAPLGKALLRSWNFWHFDAEAAADLDDV
jgi:23S rRNA pseudouridine955/2504/2580 synthase